MGLVVVIATSLAGNAPAGPIVFTYTGTGSGEIGTTPFTNQSFTITAVGDTANCFSWTSGSNVGYETPYDSASISIGSLGTYAFITPTDTFVNNFTEICGFQGPSSPYSDLYYSPSAAAWQSWNMLSSIGPVTGTGQLLQWNWQTVTTSGGRLEFNSAFCPGSFQATVVPAPSTMWNTPGGGAWNTVSTNQSWLDVSSGSAAAFSNSSDVSFNLGGTNPITVDAGGVQPGWMTFAATAGSYAFSGGAIAGTGDLIMHGGTVTLGNSNTFNGVVLVSAGTLGIGPGGSLAGATVTVNPTGCLNVGGSLQTTALSVGGSASVAAGGSLTATSVAVSGTGQFTAAGPSTVGCLTVAASAAGGATIGPAVSLAAASVNGGVAALGNLNPMASITATGGTTTLANGVNTGLLTATGGNLYAASTPNALVTAATADFSAGSPLVNTNPATGGRLAVTSQLLLPGSYAISGAFAISGTNLADNTASPRTITLSGGRVAITAPPAVTSVSIGGAAGSYSYSGGTWIVNGAGSDMWGTSEQSYFVFTPQANTSFDVSAYVDITNAPGGNGGWTKAGIMAAGGTPGAPAAPFIFAAATPSNTATFQRSDTSQSTTGGQNTADWVRLAYNAATSTFTGYYSTQPANTSPASIAWTPFGPSYAATMPSTLELGLMVTSHVDSATPATASFTNVSFMPTAPTTINFPATAVTVSSASTLDVGGASSATFGSLSVAASLTLSASQSATPLSFSNIAATATAGIRSDAAGNAQLAIRSGGTVDVAAGQTLTIGAAVVDGTSATALVKTSPGTLVLMAANTYTGGTSINAGGLVVAGSLGNTAVTVGGGARLGGTGSIAGTVVVLGGSTPGTQGAVNLADGTIGTLTLSDPNAADTVLTLGGLTVGNPSAFTFEVGAIADRIRVTAGKVAVNPGGSLINITALSGFGPGTYDLLDFPTNQASGLGYLSLATTSLEGYALSLQSTPTSEQLVVAVPEPGTLALLAAAAACGLAVWRRRRKPLRTVD